MGGGGVTKSKILTHRCHAHHGVRIFANYDRISFRTRTEFKNTFACLSGAWMGSKNEKIEAENFVTHTPFKLTKPVLDFILQYTDGVIFSYSGAEENILWQNLTLFVNGIADSIYIQYDRFRFLRWKWLSLHILNSFKDKMTFFDRISYYLSTESHMIGSGSFSENDCHCKCTFWKIVRIKWHLC